VQKHNKTLNNYPEIIKTTYILLLDSEGTRSTK